MPVINALSNAFAQFLFGAPEHVWMGYLAEAGRLLGLPV